MWLAEGANGYFSRSRISRIHYAQDALTHREEKVYDVLWGGKTQPPEESRSVKIGYTELGPGRQGLTGERRSGLLGG